MIYKKLFILLVCIALTACASVNTVESLKQTGRKDVTSTQMKLPMLKKEMSKYLSRCYKTSLVRLNGNTLGESFSIFEKDLENVYEFRVARYVKGGFHYKLIVSISKQVKSGKMRNVNMYASDLDGSFAFSKLKKITNGDKSSSCPASLF